MSSSFYEQSTFGSFFNLLMTASLISLFIVYMAFLYYLSNMDEYVLSKSVVMCCLKVFLVITFVNSVLYVMSCYSSFSIKNCSFLFSWPTSHKMILFSYVTSVLVFFCYIYLYPLWFDTLEMYKYLKPLSTCKFYVGCSKYCTADATCSMYFYISSFTYSWESNFELQKGSYNMVFNITNIMIVNFKSLVTLMKASLSVAPLYIMYLLKKKSK